MYVCVCVCMCECVCIVLVPVAELYVPYLRSASDRLGTRLSARLGRN